MSSFGELLKRERELRKISLREVSEATKINLRYLEAMERNDFRHLPGGVFNKGFVRAYAQYIGVDPEGMINAYLVEVRRQDERNGEQVEGEVLRGRAVPEQPVDSGEDRRKRTTMFALTVVVVLVVTAVVFWLVSRGGADAEGGPQQEPRATVADDRREPGSRVPMSPSDEPTPAIGTEDRAPAGTPETVAKEQDAASTVQDDRAAGTGEGAVASASPDSLRAAPDVVERSPAAATGTGHDVVALLVRPTTGRIVCDRRVEMLDGRAAGTEIRFRCTDVFLVEAVDAGAIRIGIDGRAPAALGPDGERSKEDNLLSEPQG